MCFGFFFIRVHIPIGGYNQRQTMRLLLSRPMEQQELVFPLAGGHTLYRLQSKYDRNLSEYFPTTDHDNGKPF